MNKKGFTLIELLAVIVLLGAIMLIAISSVSGISNAVKQKMYDEKIDFIEEAAVLYGEDLKNNLLESSKKYNDGSNVYNCIMIKVSELVPKYMESDTGSNTYPAVVNPKNKDEYLDNLDVIIYIRNRRIKAYVDQDKIGNLCK